VAATEDYTGPAARRRKPWLAGGAGGSAPGAAYPPPAPLRPPPGRWPTAWRTRERPGCQAADRTGAREGRAGRAARSAWPAPGGNPDGPARS